jgi:hypothetical protein
MPCQSLRVISWAAPVLMAACLDSAPNYGSGVQILPVFLSSRVDPPLHLIYEGDRLPGVSAPFRSEDNGETLVAFLVLDFEPSDLSSDIEASESDGRRRLVLAVDETLRASNYADTSRSVEFLRYAGAVVPGCHSLTLMLTHRSNWDFEAALPANLDRVSSLVWWVNVGPDRTETTIASCPTPSLVE